MSVPLDEIATMSRAVVAEQGRGLTVAAVTTTGGGGSERVEVLVDITGCHDGPCRFAVNISRADSEGFKQELEARLREAIAKHHVD
jgi:hypothetical protein